MTTVSPRLRAWPAIMMSLLPITCPARSSVARMSAACAAARASKASIASPSSSSSTSARPFSGRLDFAAPDETRFPALRLAREALDAGGARPAILNAANEVAVAAFLANRIGFLEIAAIVADTLSRYDPPAPQTLEEVLAIDAGARRVAEERMKDCVT